MAELQLLREQFNAAERRNNERFEALEEAQLLTDERLEDVGEALHENVERVDNLEAGQAAEVLRVNLVVAAQRETTARFDRTDQSLAAIQNLILEQRAANNQPQVNT